MFFFPRRTVLSLGVLLALLCSSTSANASPVHASTVPIWDGGFDTGNISQWAGNQSCPGSIKLVTSPVRSGHYAAKFTVSDSNTNSSCSAVPTDNPRAQLVSKPLFHQNDDLYIGFSTYFPAGFKAPSSWFQIAEIYGPPYGSSPSIGIDVVGNRLALDRDKTHNYDTAWKASTPIQIGKWEDIVLHVKFSTNVSVGFVEVWRNGVKQILINGSQRLYYNTLVPGVNWDGHTPNTLMLNQYRDSTKHMGTVTIYHDAARVGRSYASVALR